MKEEKKTIAAPLGPRLTAKQNPRDAQLKVGCAPWHLINVWAHFWAKCPKHTLITKGFSTNFITFPPEKKKKNSHPLLPHFFYKEFAISLGWTTTGSCPWSSSKCCDCHWRDLVATTTSSYLFSLATSSSMLKFELWRRFFNPYCPWHNST